jgi:hypothetical protein
LTDVTISSKWRVRPSPTNRRIVPGCGSASFRLECVGARKTTRLFPFLPPRYSGSQKPVISRCHLGYCSRVGDDAQKFKSYGHEHP